ncbi:MAG TPA: nuclear transport factor 2 family protein [Parvibaculum sp.]
MADPLKTWHEIAIGGDFDSLDRLLADDAIFDSPIVHTPQVGKAIAAIYLKTGLQVLSKETFRYVGEWRSENSAVLEFVSEVDGVRINGIDMIHWNDAGLVTRFKVMVRPLKAVNMLHKKMGEVLAAAG